MQFDTKRSLEYIRQQTIFLSVSLSMREMTSTLSESIISYIEDIDKHLMIRSSLQEEHTTSLAILHCAVADLQMIVSSLANHARMHERLNPGTDCRKVLLPDGATPFLRRSGKGIRELFSVLENTVEKLNDFIPIDETFGIFRDRIHQSLELISVQMETVEKLERQLNSNQNDASLLKEQIKKTFFEMEASLDKIYKNNRKLVISHFL
ncbi:MAG: hypothetical protein JXR95_04745 [Deltaproteobacteria bacterium]|nr:hypothetical protein [Deltaproteobacteria bacterium]